MKEKLVITLEEFNEAITRGIQNERELVHDITAAYKELLAEPRFELFLAAAQLADKNESPLFNVGFILGMMHAEKKAA